MKTVLALAALIAALGGAVLASGGQDQGQTFRTSTRLVQVSVTVQDRDGRPVRGLTAGDFTVMERGKAHPVAHFAVHDEVARRAAAQPAGPNVFSNVLDGRSGTGATILLYDVLNTRDVDRLQARKHVIRFLQELRPDDRIGFYVLDPSGFNILHDFTRDASSLLATIDRLTRVTPGVLAASEEPFVRGEPTGVRDAEFEAFILGAEQRSHSFFNEKRARTTAEVLELLADRFAGVQGRKSVIWVSSSFPLYFPDGLFLKSMAPEVYRATRALSHADVTIYPVDAGGLEGAFTGSASAKQRTFTTAASQAPRFDAASLIAHQTGGRAYRNTNDLRAAMQRAVEDADHTYVLGYYPADERWDGRYREISVKVARKGLRVRHRNGYYAHPPRLADAAFNQRGLFDALQSPVEATGIGLTVTADRAEGPNAFTLTIRVEPKAILLEQKADVWTGEVEIALQQLMGGPGVLRMPTMRIPLSLTDDARQQLLEKGLTLNRTISLDPGARQVRVGVRDLRSGMVGTVFLDVPQLKRLGAFDPQIEWREAEGYTYAEGTDMVRYSSLRTPIIRTSGRSFLIGPMRAR